MKKFLIIFLTLFMLIPGLIFTNNIEIVNAKSISDLRKELEKIQTEDQNNNSSIQKTDTEINQIKNDISNIYTNIQNVSDEITRTDEEIVSLNEKIEEKNDSTKKMMASLQQTEGNSFYLEYIFGADTITDFIYRYALAEQITEYNSKTINEMNDLIKQNEEKKLKLANKKEELRTEQQNLSSKLSSLSNTKVQLTELSRSLSDEIANAKSVIQMYKDAGCGEEEDINVCANRLLPPDTKFWRPFNAGYVTSEFGYRNAIYSGGKLISSSGIHEGVDLSNGLGNSNPIYSVANGKVVKVFYDQWGGNQIVVHHNVNGSYYTASYAHMSRIYVKEGEVVTKDTVLGLMGSTGSATGPHLHLAISTGLRYKDYVSYSAYVSRCVNPRNLINFPSGEKSWYNRINYYS